MESIVFAHQDIELFGEASRDRNPLHLSTDYARLTPFGEPVVFGILGGIVALAHLQDRPDRVLSRMAIEFRHPMSIGTNYAFETVEESDEQASIRLFESSQLVLRATIAFRLGGQTASPISGRDLELEYRTG